MAEIFGNVLSKKELLRYSSNMKQIAGITSCELDDGKAKGLKCFNIKNGSGLEFSVLPGRCMDIPSLTYKGINISYMAKNGVIDSKYCYPYADEFVNYMTGGILFTAGLLNAGNPSTDDDGTYYPIHGRIGTTPAENVSSKEFWQDDDYIIECSGIMRESKLFGHNLTLTRSITTKLGCNALEIHDTLENLAPEPQEFMLLYHINFGFPFLNEHLKVDFPQNTISPRTEEAKKGLSEAQIFTKPQDGFFEHVFFRDVKDNGGTVYITLENTDLGIGVKLSYVKENLPVLVQWKCMRSGDYALGIEPANCFIKGRKAERENGTLKTIKPFEKLDYKIRLEFYDI